MAMHRWSLVCRSAVTDSSNSLDILGIVDEILAAGIPDEIAQSGKAGLQVNLELVSVWQRNNWNEPEPLEVRLRYLDPLGEMLGQTDPLSVNLSEYPVVRVISKLPIVQLRGYGVYRIVVESRATEKDAWQPAPNPIAIGIWKREAQIAP